MGLLLAVGLCLSTAVAQDQAARAQEKANQETVAAKPWFDLQNCAMCKHLAAEEGLMDAMHWEIHKIDNGMLTVATIPENMKAKFKKAEAAMAKTAKEMESGKELPLCGFCEAYGKLMAAGVKTQEFKGEAANVSLITSDDPAVVKQIHAMADRTIKEHKAMMENKGKESKTSTGIK
jgi:hypothetical protein